MAQPGPSITPPVDLNKAFGAAGATGLGGAVTKITMRIINTKWPGLLEGLDDPVDLVITDIYMDVMDGIETVTAVKKQFPHIKIIAMSGGSRLVNMDSLPLAKMLGADRTLAKPADISELLELIAELDKEMGG